ncbi:MAG: hypothetical protein ACLTQI_03495 [Slackia sp.]
MISADAVRVAAFAVAHGMVDACTVRECAAPSSLSDEGGLIDKGVLPMKLPIDVMAVFQGSDGRGHGPFDSAGVFPFCSTTPLPPMPYGVCALFVRERIASGPRLGQLFHGRVGRVPRSDMAVIAAGITPEVGSIAARIREAGVPVMVVTTLPELVSATARKRFPIPRATFFLPS